MYIIRKSRNTAWLYDNNKTFLATDVQKTPTSVRTESRTVLPLNKGNDVPEDSLNPVLTPSINFYTGRAEWKSALPKTRARAQPIRNQIKCFQAGFFYGGVW